MCRPRRIFALLVLVACASGGATGTSAQQIGHAMQRPPRTVYLAPLAGPAVTRGAEAFDAAMLAALARRLDATGAYRVLTWDLLLSLKPAHVELAPRHALDPCLVGLQLAVLAAATVDVRWCGVTDEIEPGHFRISGTLRRMRGPEELTVDAASVTDPEEAAAMIFERFLTWEE